VDTVGERLAKRAAAVAAAALVATAAGAPRAEARLAVVATGTADVALLDVTTNTVVSRPAQPAATRAVAVSHDGHQAFLAAGTAVAALDLRTLQPGARADIAAPAVGLALSPQDGTVYAAAGRDLVVMDARSLSVRRRIGLRGDALGLAVSRQGTLAAVPLAQGRVAIVGLTTGRLLRRVRLAGAASAAFDAVGRAWVAARGRLTAVAPGSRKPDKHPIKLEPGVGGGVAASPDGRTMFVGAARGGHKAAVVDVFTRKVRLMRSGAGPGTPAWSPDGARVYVADAGSASLSLVSPFAHRRIGVIALPGSAPAGVVVQPGLARVAGTDAPDLIVGTRGPDLIEGFGGDDVLRGGRDSDVLFGGDGNDLLVGGSYDDRIEGGPGDDRVDAGSGDDRVAGGLGADTVDGGTGPPATRSSPEPASTRSSPGPPSMRSS